MTQCVRLPGVRAAGFQNGVFIAMCNRVGAEGEVVFCGEFMVVGLAGDVVVKAGTSEQLLIADLDLTEDPRARATLPVAQTTGSVRVKHMDARCSARTQDGDAVAANRRWRGP
jgi:predicted amidohydrolase